MTPQPTKLSKTGRERLEKSKPIRMKAGYSGGSCEVCLEPIRIGDTYFFLRDENATVACAKCVIASTEAE